MKLNLFHNIFAGLLLSFSAIASSQSPDQLWEQDLAALKQHLEAAHPNLYHSTNKAEFESALTFAQKQTTQQTQYIALARALALVGDGHTAAPLLPLPFNAGVSFEYTPLQFKVFSDGVYVIAASQEQNRFIGFKLVAINGIATESVLDNIATLISADNPYWMQDLSGYYLSNINAINWATGQPAGATPQFEFINTNEERVSLQISEDMHVSDINWMQDFYLSSPNSEWKGKPLAGPLLNCKRNYCSERIHSGDTLYMNIRAMRDDETSFAEFVEQSFASIENEPVKNLIIDLRLNRGGNGSLRWPLIYKLAEHRLNSSNTLVVLSSNKIFSAGMMLAVDLEKHSNAVFIGENTGSSPNHYGETSVFELPNSGFKIIHSSLYWQNARPDDRRDSIAPDAAISNSSELFFSGRDEAFDIASRYLEAQALQFNPKLSNKGQALIYDKSNIDGSNAAKIAVYYHDNYNIEAFKWHEGNDHATIVRASLDENSLLVKEFSVSSFHRDHGEQQRGKLQAENPFTIKLALGDFKQTFHTQGSAWHSYDFDFSSLGFIYPHLNDKHQYDFQIYDMDMTQSPPKMKSFGWVSMFKQEEERKLGKKAIKYSIDGQGLDHRGGHIWFDKKTGRLLHYEIQKPDESSYNSGKLSLESVRPLTADQWQAFKQAAVNAQ